MIIISSHFKKPSNCDLILKWVSRVLIDLCQKLITAEQLTPSREPKQKNKSCA